MPIPTRHRCIKSCIHGGKYYRNGLIYINVPSPPASKFEVTTDDKVTGSPASYTDLDETYYFGKGIVGWEDMRFPAVRSLQGILSKPDFDDTNIGLLFPQDDVSEIAYMLPQFPHGMLREAIVYPHIHYVQDTADLPIFKMDYRIHQPGTDPTGAFTTIATTGVVVTYVSGSISQILEFPEIDMVGFVGPAAMIDTKIYRDDDVVAGDVLVKEFDIHYPVDSVGSGGLYNK